MMLLVILALLSIENLKHQLDGNECYLMGQFDFVNSAPYPRLCHHVTQHKVNVAVLG